MKTSGGSPAHKLGEELDAGNVLLLLLQQEQEHLINADLDGLARITEEKAKTIARMTELAQRRHLLLASTGFDASESGMQTWLESSAAAAGASKSWNDLLGIAQKAKELNRTNGLLIGQHMARNQNALNVLQGNQQGGTMYGPNGQSTSPASSRRLVVG